MDCVMPTSPGQIISSATCFQEVTDGSSRPRRGGAGSVRWIVALLSVCLFLAVAEPGLAGSRKAKKLFNQARRAELAKDFDQALDLYDQALAEDPEDPRHQLASRRMRFVAAQRHVMLGRIQRDQGHFEEAAHEFLRALEIDPASTIANQERKRTLDLIERQSKSESGEIDIETPLERDRAERKRRMERLKELPELEPISTRPLGELTFRDQESKVVFETIGKLAGINVLFDSDYDDEKITFDLKNVTLYEALDYTSLLAKAFWKPLTRNAIFVTNDSPNKRREFDDEIVKTFYLSNVGTPQELQEVVQAIRGLTELRRLFPVNSQNAIVVRGSPDRIALAEKIITDVDKARPEVIIDVLVIETSESSTRDLGIAPISGGRPGINIPLTYTGEGVGAGGGGSVPLSDLGASSRDWATTLPGGTIEALLSRSDTRLLQSPRVRAADNFQAELRIGQRIPIATGSFQPGIGGVGINPLVNTQFQYVDVGVNLDLQPRIHNDREVSLHIEVEVSNVADFLEIGGISQPVIGQRTVSHDVRIEQGHSSVLGGLMQTQTFTTRAGVPLLSDIPIVGRLFSTEQVQVNETEILIVLVPHIVRMPDVQRANLRSVASGTDQIFRVRYQEEENRESPLRSVGHDPESADQPIAVSEARPDEKAHATPSITTPAPAPTEPPQQPAEAPSSAQPEAAPQPEPQPASAPSVQAEPQVGDGARFVLRPAAPTVTVGGKTEVEVIIRNVKQLFGVPLRIRFDGRVMRLADITKGTFLEGDESDLIFSKNIRNEVGQAAVNISRFPGTGGVDGEGLIITLIVEGVSAGDARLRVIPTGARNGELRPLQIESAETRVTVQ